jgi:hypothetical protein
MRAPIHIIILALISGWLIWSGVMAVRKRRAYFGKGYGRYSGKKAVILGYAWIASGGLLVIIGILIIL